MKDKRKTKSTVCELNKIDHWYVDLSIPIILHCDIKGSKEILQ